MTMRFVMIGGFLGAGKTTTIGRLAALYQAQGLKVGIVTNDQATDLVDTHTLRNQGFDVGEVAGACFCCHFNELTATTSKLSKEHYPDVIIAEPVGSCTDLVATVIQPLKHLHQNEFEVAPYGVILKPSHGRRILRGETNAGFSPKAAYIFEKQLEEADFLILNRIDELSTDQIEELESLLAEKHPDIPVIKISAKTGAGMQQLIEQFDLQGEYGNRILELDYDIYAAGEAELGWLNSSLKVTADVAFDLDTLLLDIIERMRIQLDEIDGETAHLKTIGVGDAAHAVANLISSDTPAQVSLASKSQLKEANIIVNARVAIAPEVLTELVHTCVCQAVEAIAGEVRFGETQSFRPGRPVPTHRYQSS
ncbi:MAG: cobalamin biosynthesis protein P47K [Planctomycetaceae bacterium]|nr:cobalamin biosynthesis protein P47K [Planctomycetaceae bacterium]